MRWLRFLILVPVLITGMYQGGSDSWRRITVGFMPAYITPAPDITLVATITPPDYTRLGAVVLSDGTRPLERTSDGGVIHAPVGSIISLSTDEQHWRPAMVWGKEAAALRAQGDGTYALSGEIKADSNVQIREGSQILAKWPIRVVADEKPTVAMLAPLQITARQSLKISMDAEDDYGVSYLGLGLSLSDEPGAPEMFVPLNTYQSNSVHEVQYANLISHPWAGRKVKARLVALDGAGQEARSQSVEIDLPRMKFRNVLAMSLVQIRNGLLEGGDALHPALRRLKIMAAGPEHSSHDVATYLGIRTAYLRAARAADFEQRKEIAALLWDMALDQEDGGIAIAREEMHDRLDRLRMVIKSSASNGDIDIAMASFVEGLGLFDAVRRDANYLVGIDMDRLADLREGLDWAALDKFFTTAREKIIAGRYDELADMFDGLKSGLENQGDILLSAGAYRRYLVASYARQIIVDLQKEQRDLLQQSMRETIQRDMAGKEHEDREFVPDQVISDQQALADGLSLLIDHLDKAGLNRLQAFSSARRSMEDALNYMRRNIPSNVTDAQIQSLTALDMAVRELGTVPSPVGPDWKGGTQDPLGRPLPGGLFNKGSSTAEETNSERGASNISQ